MFTPAASLTSACTRPPTRGMSSSASSWGGAWCAALDIYRVSQNNGRRGDDKSCSLLRSYTLPALAGAEFVSGPNIREQYGSPSEENVARNLRPRVQP